MGFDKPQKIKANAQGGILAAPAWTAFMNEVYKRKPAPRDWPMPGDIVHAADRRDDEHARRRRTARATSIGNEFFIPGTDPVLQCDVHTRARIRTRSASARSIRRAPRRR